MSYHNKLRVYIHYVWATWDRCELITDEVERPLHRCIEAIFDNCGCPVLAVNGMSDHVRVLVKMSNTISMADLTEKVKGGSSRYLNEDLLAGEFKWQGSYGAFSVSPHEKQKVIRYIEGQKEHHAAGTVWSHAEETTEFRDRTRAVVTGPAPATAGAQPQAPQR